MAVPDLGTINHIFDFKFNACVQNGVLDPAVLEDDAYMTALMNQFLNCANLLTASLQASEVLAGNNADANLNDFLAGGFRGAGSWLSLTWAGQRYYANRKKAESYPALAKAFAAAAPREKQEKIYGRAALCCLFFDRTPTQLFGAASFSGDPAADSATRISVSGGEVFPFYGTGGDLPEKKRIVNPADHPVDIELCGRRVCIPPKGALPVIMSGAEISAVPAGIVPAGDYVGLFHIGGERAAAGTLDLVTGAFSPWEQAAGIDHAIFVGNRWRTAALGNAEIDGVTVEDAIALAGSGQAWCVLTAKGAVVSNLPALSTDAGAVGVACVGAEPAVLLRDGSVRSDSGDKTRDDYRAALLSTFPEDNSTYARICRLNGAVLYVARDGTLSVRHGGETEAKP